MNINNIQPVIHNEKINSDKVRFTGLSKKFINNEKFLNLLISEKTNKIINYAEKNPSMFNFITGAILATTFRPVAILIVPGAKKEDKQYAAAKSAISALVSIIMQGIIYIPLANSIEKLGKTVKDRPEVNFPKINTPEFKAFNFLFNIGISALLTPITMGITFKALGAFMNKFFPAIQNSKNTKNLNSIKLSENSNVIYKNFLNRKKD